jgi:hypothetical protein
LLETYRLASYSQRGWLTSTTLVLVLGAGCSSAFDNRQRAGVETGEADKSGLGELRFPDKDLAAKHRLAKASPRSFDPVFDHARAVAVFCLASLVDTTCESCADGVVRYKQRSELNPFHWPLIEDSLSMLDELTSVQKLASAQMEPLVSVKGQLLWLAGRSTEEQTLIDDYARAHPDAVVVIKRRLELLREADDVTKSESQCSRSRVKMESSPEAALLDLLTSCVALHPGNTDGRNDPPDYAKYLPNLTIVEDQLYRAHLVQHCVENLGDEETRCAQACACNDNPSDKRHAVQCKRTCRDCRNETVQGIRACKKIGEVAPASRQRVAPARAHRPKAADDPDSAPQQAEL